MSVSATDQLAQLRRLFALARAQPTSEAAFSKHHAASPVSPHAAPLGYFTHHACYNLGSTGNDMAEDSPLDQAELDGPTTCVPFASLRLRHLLSVSF
jgi:hypothetical protein